MNDYREPVDTVDLGESYADKPKRRISGPKKVANKSFKDKFKKIIATVLALGTIAGGAYAVDQIIEKSERSDVIEMFDNTLVETYETSEFLQSHFRESDYLEYCKGTLDDTLKSEESLVEFFSNEEFNENAWLYILIGEGNRLQLKDENIISSLKQFEPYSENVSFDKETGNPEKQVSYFSKLAMVCLTEENRADFISLLDAIVGSSSLSNSQVAISHAKEQVKSIHFYIEDGYKPTLQEMINNNNNFEQNYERDNQYLQPYIDKMYNTRIQTAKAINDGKTFTNVKNPELLMKITRSLSKRNVIKDSYSTLRYGNFEMDSKVASPEEYSQFRETRNEQYQYCIDGIDNPEKAQEELAGINSKLDKISDIYVAFNSKDAKFLEEIFSIISQQQEVEKSTNKRSSDLSR